jgi:hypothetical protein
MLVNAGVEPGEKVPPKPVVPTSPMTRSPLVAGVNDAAETVVPAACPFIAGREPDVAVSNGLEHEVHAPETEKTIAVPLVGPVAVIVIEPETAVVAMA